jgi:hypothetical protein
VSVVLVAAMSAGCADDVAPAARVGDEEITTDELLAEVAEWAGNPGSPRAEQLAATGAPSGYATATVSAILGERIVIELMAPAFEDLELQLTEDDRAEAFGYFGIDPSQADAALEGFDEAYIRGYVDGFAKIFAVRKEIGDEAFLELLRKSAKEVEVNPRYGTWDPNQLAVVPPEGPRPAPGSALTAEL